MDDVVRAVLIALGVLVVVGLAVIGFLMWRFKIPPRGVVAMFGALFYLALPVDVVPEALLGPLGLVDDTGVVAVVGDLGLQAGQGAPEAGRGRRDQAPIRVTEGSNADSAGTEQR